MADDAPPTPGFDPSAFRKIREARSIATGVPNTASGDDLTSVPLEEAGENRFDKIDMDKVSRMAASKPVRDIHDIHIHISSKHHKILDAFRSIDRSSRGDAIEKIIEQWVNLDGMKF